MNKFRCWKYQTVTAVDRMLQILWNAEEIGGPYAKKSQGKEICTEALVSV